jgi:hypothetical protein
MGEEKAKRLGDANMTSKELEAASRKRDSQIADCQTIVSIRQKTPLARLCR